MDEPTNEAVEPGHGQKRRISFAADTSEPKRRRTPPRSKRPRRLDRLPPAPTDRSSLPVRLRSHARSRRSLGQPIIRVVTTGLPHPAPFDTVSEGDGQVPEANQVAQFDDLMDHMVLFMALAEDTGSTYAGIPYVVDPVTGDPVLQFPPGWTPHLAVANNGLLGRDPPVTPGSSGPTSGPSSSYELASPNRVRSGFTPPVDTDFPQRRRRTGRGPPEVAMIDAAIASAASVASGASSTGSSLRYSSLYSTSHSGDGQSTQGQIPATTADTTGDAIPNVPIQDVGIQDGLVGDGHAPTIDLTLLGSQNTMTWPTTYQRLLPLAADFAEAVPANVDQTGLVSNNVGATTYPTVGPTEPMVNQTWDPAFYDPFADMEMEDIQDPQSPAIIFDSGSPPQFGPPLHPPDTFGSIDGMYAPTDDSEAQMDPRAAIMSDLSRISQFTSQHGFVPPPQPPQLYDPYVQSTCPGYMTPDMVEPVFAPDQLGLVPAFDVVGQANVGVPFNMIGPANMHHADHVIGPDHGVPAYHVIDPSHMQVPFTVVGPGHMVPIGHVVGPSMLPPGYAPAYHPSYVPDDHLAYHPILPAEMTVADQAEPTFQPHYPFGQPLHTSITSQLGVQQQQTLVPAPVAVFDDSLALMTEQANWGQLLADFPPGQQPNEGMVVDEPDGDVGMTDGDFGVVEAVPMVSGVVDSLPAVSDLVDVVPMPLDVQDPVPLSADVDFDLDDLMGFDLPVLDLTSPDATVPARPAVWIDPTADPTDRLIRMNAELQDIGDELDGPSDGPYDEVEYRRDDTLDDLNDEAHDDDRLSEAATELVADIVNEEAYMDDVDVDDYSDTGDHDDTNGPYTNNRRAPLRKRFKPFRVSRPADQLFNPLDHYKPARVPLQWEATAVPRTRSPSPVHEDSGRARNAGPIDTQDPTKPVKIRYDVVGSFAVPTMTSSQVRGYIQSFSRVNGTSRRLIIWIQRKPTDSARRVLFDHNDRCLLEECPTRWPMNAKFMRGTIPVGTFQATFDEQWIDGGGDWRPAAPDKPTWSQLARPGIECGPDGWPDPPAPASRDRQIDPFTSPGRMHLYCFERYVGLKFATTQPAVRVVPDCRLKVFADTELGGQFRPSLELEGSMQMAIAYLRRLANGTFYHFDSPFINHPTIRTAEAAAATKNYVHENSLTYSLTVERLLSVRKTRRRAQTRLNTGKTDGRDKWSSLNHLGDIILFALLRKTYFAGGRRVLSGPVGRPNQPGQTDTSTRPNPSFSDGELDDLGGISPTSLRPQSGRVVRLRGQLITRPQTALAPVAIMARPPAPTTAPTTTAASTTTTTATTAAATATATATTRRGQGPGRRPRRRGPAR